MSSSVIATRFFKWAQELEKQKKPVPPCVIWNDETQTFVTNLLTLDGHKGKVANEVKKVQDLVIKHGVEHLWTHDVDLEEKPKKKKARAGKGKEKSPAEIESEDDLEDDVAATDNGQARDAGSDVEEEQIENGDNDEDDEPEAHEQDESQADGDEVRVEVLKDLDVDGADGDVDAEEGEGIRRKKRKAKSVAFAQNPGSDDETDELIGEHGEEFTLAAAQPPPPDSPMHSASPTATGSAVESRKETVVMDTAEKVFIYVSVSPR